MPGLWLTRVARRLTRPDTFDHLVSPAIADLQAESESRWFRLRHYAALVAVIACALMRDFRIDVAQAFDRDARRNIWIRAALWSLAAGLFNWAMTFQLTRFLLGALGGEPYDGMALTHTGLRSLVPAMTVAMIVAAYHLRRRDAGNIRAVVAGTAVMAVVTLVISLSAGALESQRSFAVEMGVYATQATHAVVFRWPPLPWRMLTAAVSMIPFAWLGVVLARRQGWPLAVISTTILGSWVALNFISIAALDFILRAVPALQLILAPMVIGTYAIPPNLLTLVMLILIWRAVETGIDRLTLAKAAKAR